MTLDEIKNMDKTSCVKFSEFAKDQLPIPGNKKFMDDILNKEIIVTDFKISNSKKKEGQECLKLQFLLNDEVCVVFTSSSVLIRQVRAAADKMPFIATVVKIDKYYSFS